MKKLRPAPFKFKPFSEKQLKVLKWWRPDSPFKDKDAIICDGSVRAGKTVVMSLSYVIWAMDTFSEENLGMSGKTIGSLRRNVIAPLKRMLKSRGYKVKDHRADNFLTITFKGVSNYFYIFGGKDESSQDLIQGITLAGMFFDEVALMPQSFVNQATARCSVRGAKFWFNCNPAGPYHWFKLEWLNKKEEKNALHLHFTMDDNLSIDPKTKERYYRMYAGIFFQRYILGLWVIAEGVVYGDDYNPNIHRIPRSEINEMIKKGAFREYIAGTDFGYSHAMTGLLYGVTGDPLNPTYYQIDEFYKTKQKTEALRDWYLKWEEKLGKKIFAIFCDSAEPDRIITLQEAGLRAVGAKKDIGAGINSVQTAFKNDRLYICEDCVETDNELQVYRYPEETDPKARKDQPLDENNHAMDGKRYAIHNYELYLVRQRNKDKKVRTREEKREALQKKRRIQKDSNAF